MYELASMMTLYELGNVRLVADHYNIREVYNFTEKTTPVVFISPNQVTDIESCDGTNGEQFRFRGSTLCWWVNRLAHLII